jgi:hypothetical protein
MREQLADSDKMIPNDYHVTRGATMRKILSLAAVMLVTGCEKNDDLIGRTVMVSDSGNHIGKWNMPGKVLTIGNEKVNPKWLPTYSDPFRAVVIADVPATTIDGEPYPACWRVKPEEGAAAREVVDVFKQEVILTIIR